MTKKKQMPMPKPGEYADLLRSLVLRAETLDVEGRSIEVVVASETPVPVYDWERGEVVDEILLMDGVKYRKRNKQIPLVDSHSRGTVDSLLGSIRNLDTEGTQLVGRAYFGTGDAAQRAFENFRDGHLDEISVGARILEMRRVAKGETFNLAGRAFRGPVNLVTKWMPLEGSAVVVGADPTATARSEKELQVMRAYQEPYELEKTHMDAAFRSLLLEKGMPDDLEGADALDWAQKNLVDRADAGIEPPANSAGENTVSNERTANESGGVTQADVEAAVRRATETERNRQSTIRSIVRGLSLDEELADELIRKGADENDARKAAIDAHANRTKVSGVNSDQIEFGADRTEKFAAAARDGLTERCFKAAGLTAVPYAGEKAAPGADEFSRRSLLRLAEDCVELMGHSTRRMSKRDIVSIAMGNRDALHRLGLVQRDTGAAYHTTGMFSNLLLDASNKTLLASYDEAPFTWATWARQAQSVPDFKTINRIRFSEAPNPEMVPETHPYKEKSLSDSKESYKVEKYGEIYSMSWETYINDDMDAFARVPAMHGTACRRAQNALVYGILTANAALSDSVALFHSTHNNLSGANANPSVTTLNTAFLKMLTQTGLKGSTLNIVPRFLLAPVALSATVLQLLASLADPTAGGSAAGNSNTFNIYGPSGPRPLVAVIDPQLDANSATAWYLAASPSQVDTVELAFLEGEETPVMEREMGFETDTLKFKVRQTMGAKAIDYRGLYKYST